MRKTICASILLTVLSFTGCAMPTTSVRTVDDRPTIAIKNAPEGAILFVDNLNMGLANKYDGNPAILTVEPGTHIVRVVAGNDTIYEQKVFVEDSLKTITVR